MKVIGRVRSVIVGAVERRALLTALIVSLAAGAAGAGRAQSGQFVARVTDSGFTPSSATAEPGLVHLSLENGSGSDSVRIRIAREGGGQIREIEIRRNGAAVSTELDAAAGVYTLTEAERGWVFRLTVGGGVPAPTPALPPEDE